MIRLDGPPRLARPLRALSRELREGARSWKWILRHAQPRVLAAPFLLVWPMNGVALLLHPTISENSPLIYPAAFGYALLLLCLMGFVAVTFNLRAVLAVFAMLGLIVRAWMAALYFMRFPFELSWMNMAGGAMVMVWIFARTVCDMTARYVKRQAQAQLARSVSEKCGQRV